MHACYEDIISRIKEPPLWFDEAGVPRYSAFTPQNAHQIYCQEAVLAEIACQSCGTRFQVCLSRRHDQPGQALAEQIRKRSLTYGDPPHSGCCDDGPSMTSETLRVLEYWSKNQPCDKIDGTPTARYYLWSRHQALEIAFSESSWTDSHLTEPE